jgi:predicted O-linked N-acetylglucosamine transferase (SPINDLY family)
MTIDDALQLAVAHHQAGRRAEAEGLYRQVLAACPDHADALHLLGALACEQGRTDLALELIGKAIAIHPTAAEYHHNLGETYRRSAQWEQAMTSFRRAIALRPDDAEAHNSLGVALFETGRTDEAIAAHRRAIQLQPGHAWAHVNLGNALSAAGQYDEAIVACQRAIDLQPTFPEAHNSLGAVLKAMGRTDPAIAAYHRALELRPDYAEARNNLGNALIDQGRLEEAISQYDRAVALKPDLAEAHSNLIVALHVAGRMDQARLDAALACLDQARTLRPDSAELHKLTARVLEWEGKTAEAHAALDRALEIRPSDALAVRRALLLPVIYSSLDELPRERTRLEENLNQLSTRSLAIANPVDDVGLNTFYLAYQGGNDRDLLVRLAALHRAATPSLVFEAPHCRPPTLSPWERVAEGRVRAGAPPGAIAAPRPGEGQRATRGQGLGASIIRVGFVSRCFHRHTIGKLNLGFVRNLSREHFSVTLLRFPGPDDAMARAFDQSADQVVRLPLRLEVLRQRIAELQLDVLYYCDIGMDAWTYFLAHARLAPVQCVTWGHPVTTGIPTIDYFVSSRLLEPEDAAEHYSEELAPLEKLNVYYYEPSIAPPVKSRSALGLDETANLYVCPQSLFKIHPGFDVILAGILRGDPRGRVVLIEGTFAHWKTLLAARFERSFPDVADRVVFLPRVSQDDFLHLLARADVLLDTTPFSGGSTSYEAFASGTPVVTLPGRLLRGRITAACYQQMGVLDCIARSEDEYVQIALRLGMDPAWRDHVRGEILRRKHLLFEDAAAVRQLESFLHGAVERARAGKPSPPGRGCPKGG